jgi:hypothetical protein
LVACRSSGAGRPGLPRRAWTTGSREHGDGRGGEDRCREPVSAGRLHGVLKPSPLRSASRGDNGGGIPDDPHSLVKLTELPVEVSEHPQSKRHPPVPPRHMDEWWQRPGPVAGWDRVSRRSQELSDISVNTTWPSTRGSHCIRFDAPCAQFSPNSGTYQYLS